MAAVDVLVIGGGLTGCATAFHLAGTAGVSVAVLEAGQINQGASGQNAGSLHFQIERRFLENSAVQAENAARIVAVNRLAVQDWRGLEAELGAALDVEMHGGLMVAETAEQVRLLEWKIAQENRWGLATRLLDGDQARALAPYLSDAIVAASFSAEEGHANPRAVTPAYAEAARRRGARILTGTRLNGLRRDAKGRFRASAVQNDKAIELVADRVLLAAGAWSVQAGALANLHLPVFPVGLTMSVTERTAPFMRHMIQHVGKRLSMKQTSNGNLLIGGGWRSQLNSDGQGGFDLWRRPVLMEPSLRDNLKGATETVPSLKALNLIRTWTGTASITADELPIVGELPRAPGLFVSAGGSGFTLGPTLARLLSGWMIQGDAPEELAIFSPGRFDHLNSFMGL